MKRILLIIVATVVVIGVVALVMLGRLPPREKRLSDGTILRLEQVSFGKQGSFTPLDGWWQRLKTKIVPHLPKALARHFPTPPVGSTPSWSWSAAQHPNSNALTIWIARRDGITGGFKNVGAESAELVDEHGCTLFATQVGGENLPSARPPAGPNGISSALNWFRFEAFPRHERNFKVRFYEHQPNDLQIVLAEFTVPNPAYVPLTAGTPAAETLPVKVVQGDVTFALTSVTISTNAYRRISLHRPFDGMAELVPAFACFTNGVASTEWQPVNMELWDSDGNFASKLPGIFYGGSLFLCPKVREWRLVVDFCGSELSESASNQSWTIHDVKIPKPGEFTSFSGSSNIHGAIIIPIALAGAGETVYTGNTPTSASVPQSNQWSFNMSGTGWGTSGTKTITSKKPHLALLVAGLKDSQRLTVRAHDDQGRDIFATDWQYAMGLPVLKPFSSRYISWGDPVLSNGKISGELAFLCVDLPEGAKTVDLTFCVHNSRILEFKFKPPQR